MEGGSLCSSTEKRWRNVDGFVCSHVDDIIVEGESELYDALFVSSLQELQTAQGDLSWHPGCAFERDKACRVLRIMSRRAFIEYFASGYGVNTPVLGLSASQSADLGPIEDKGNSV